MWDGKELNDYPLVFPPTHWCSISQVDGSRSLLASWFSCHQDTQITGYNGPNGRGLAASPILSSAGNISALSFLQQLRNNTSIYKHNRCIVKIPAPLVASIFGGGGVRYKPFQGSSTRWLEWCQAMPSYPAIIITADCRIRLYLNVQIILENVSL